MNEIYKTEANKVVLSDLKREFKSYLEANNLCRGEIPEGLKIHVGSRIKMFAPKTHMGLGYVCTHQSTNKSPKQDTHEGTNEGTDQGPYQGTY